ncbi:MAG: hypothetical protein Q9219_000149 [cf. Caloplaca sp. 3 TL-2023]
MVHNTRQAILAQDARQLVNAIKDLFSVLETMKLDVANHQIRYLRFYLLQDGIQFEQSQILSRIAAGWSIPHQDRWFGSGDDNRKEGNQFTNFTDRTIEYIISCSQFLPTTFSADFDRLRALQHDFWLCHYHAVCVAALRGTLNQLGRRCNVPDRSEALAMQNIWAVIVGLGKDFACKAHSAVILQIVMEAFQICNISALPDSTILSTTLMCFNEALNDAGTAGNELADLVHSEAETIFNMTPLEILNRYNPGSSSPSDGHWKAVSLENLARRTAHVIVLHWRVWAPILYTQSSELDCTTGPAIVTSEQEMSERRPSRVSVSSVNTSGPTVTPGEITAQRSQTGNLRQTRSRSDSPEYALGTADAERSVNDKSKMRSKPSSL